MDCEWGDWKIGECSVTCGRGTRTNNRTKIVQENNGGECIGDATVQADCHDQICPGEKVL